MYIADVKLVAKKKTKTKQTTKNNNKKKKTTTNKPQNGDSITNNKHIQNIEMEFCKENVSY